MKNVFGKSLCNIYIKIHYCVVTINNIKHYFFEDEAKTFNLQI